MLRIETSDLPSESTTAVDMPERRFEELAFLQRLLAAREQRLEVLELELKTLRQRASGGNIEMQVAKAALEIDVARLSEALCEKERARFELEEDLRALTDDHLRISHDLELLQRSGDPNDARAAPLRSELILQIQALQEASAVQRAELAHAIARLDRSTLSEPFDAEDADPISLTTRAERRMRRQQMAILTQLMSELAARTNQNG